MNTFKSISYKLVILVALIVVLSSYSSALPSIVFNNDNELNLSGDITNPDFYIDDYNNINIVWQDNSTDTLYYAKTDSEGNIITSRINIASDAQNPLIDKKLTNQTVFWESLSNKIFYIFADVASMVPEGQLLSDEKYSSMNPSISSSGNFLYSAWESFINNQKTLIYSKLSGDYWSDRINMTSEDSNATNPSLSSKGSNVYVSWIDDRDDDQQVYFKMYKGNTNIDNSYPDSDRDGLVDVLEQGYANNTNATYDDQDTSSTTNYTNVDTDGDGLPDGWVDGWIYVASNHSWKINYSALDNVQQSWEGEDLNLNGKVDAGETDPNDWDSDNDNLPDGWEQFYVLNALSNTGIYGATGDPDGDLLPNIAEYGNHTNPSSQDSDNDGLRDDYEILNGINPNNEDTDDDGLIDGAELYCTTDLSAGGLEPGDTIIGCLDNDSDDDGVLDGYEMYETAPYSYNCGPTDNCDSDTLPNMLDYDSDNDGISDGIEFRGGLDRISPVKKDADDDGINDPDEDKNKNGIVDTGETDPTNPDTDNDGLWDGNFTEFINERGIWTRYESGEFNSGTNPKIKDTDGDGLTDFQEIIGWDIYVNGRTRHVTSNPLTPYSDSDCYHTTGFECSSGAELSDLEEYNLGTDPRRYDTDGDLILDYYEIYNLSSNPFDDDTDDDGVLDGVETNIIDWSYLLHTNVTNPDTDQDGLLDSEGSWVMFRTNATGINGGQLITENFTGGAYYYDLAFTPTDVSSVYWIHPGGYTNVTLTQGSGTLGETEYDFTSGGPTENGYVYTGHNLVSGEVIFISANCDFGGGVQPCSNPPYNGPGNSFLIYGLVQVLDAKIQMAGGMTQTELTELAEGANLTDAEYIVDAENKQIITGRDLLDSERLQVNYYSNVIVYENPINDGSWIAATDEDLEHPLMPFGRIDGVIITDAQNSNYISKYSYDYLGVTAEGYPVTLIEHEALNSLIPGISQRFNSVAWNPNGEFALMAGQAVGGTNAIYKIYKNTSYDIIQFNDSRSVRDIAWTPDGSYALLVGDSGLIIKYDTSSNSFTKLNGTSNNLKAVTFTKEYDSLMNNLGLIVGNGTILRINITNNTLENFTLPSGLGSTSYNYIDVASVYGNYVVIITADAKAFMYNWYMADLQRTFTLGPTPTLLTSVDWKYGLDEKSGKFIHNGIFTGKSGTGNYIYYCDFSGVCSNKVLTYSAGGTPEVSDAKWNPHSIDIIITMKKTYDNPLENTGAIFKWRPNESSATLLEIVPGAMLTKIGWHPSGDYAYIVSESVKEPFTQLFSYINNPFVIIDVPGEKNPIYGSPEQYNLASEGFDAFTGRGLIPNHPSGNPNDPLNFVTEYRKEIMFTDPLNPKTHDDGLLDGQRFKLEDWDADGDFIANMFEDDADNDGILNGEEVFWNSNTDGDVNMHDTRRQPLINALDADSDNDGINDTFEVRVVFRISNRTYGPGTWIGVQLGEASSTLEGFVYSGNITYNISGLTQLNHSMIGNQYPIETPDDYYVFTNGTHIFVDVPGPKYAVYTTTGSIPDNSAMLNLVYSLTHRETYTAGSMLGIDADNDLLNDPIDPYPLIPDVDFDGLIDGLEHEWNASTDGDGKKNYNDSDSDNDGLPDGWIDGWCYNATRPGHADSIHGWGLYCTPDGIKQDWEGEDLNLDGGEWWSERTTITAEGTTKFLQSETNPLWPDSDGDGLLDGDERLYGLDPLRGYDLDNDGISDYVEIKEYFMADSVNLGDYYSANVFMGSPSFKKEWAGSKYVDTVKLSGTGITAPLKLIKRGYYKINLLGPDLNGSAWIEIRGQNGTIYKPINPVVLSQNNVTIFSGELDAGIYEIQIDGVVEIWVHRLTAYRLGLDYNNSDTDHDGIIDGKEEGYGKYIWSSWPYFATEDLSDSSPLDPDSDDDGLLDGQELVLGTSPINPDSDDDGVDDKNDLMPLKNLNIGNPWNEIFPAHTLYYDTEYYFHYLNGRSSSVNCVYNIGDHCASESYTDLGTQGTRNSPRDNQSREYTIEKALNPQLKYYEPWEIGYNSHLVYDVVNMTYGVEKEGYIRLYSISTDRSYSYGHTGVVASIDAYPTYTIDYDLRGEAYTVTLANGQPCAMMEGIGWIPQSNKTMIENESNQGLKYVYTTQNMFFDIGKNQQLTFQLSIDPELDMMRFENVTSYIIPAFEYRLYDGAFSWATGVMSSYAVAKPIELIATRHSYEFTMNFPKDKILKDHYILYVSPIYLININGRISRYPINDFKFTGASLVRTVEDHSYTVRAKLTENLTAIDNAVPDDLSSYSTGMQTFGGYNVYLYKGTPENFTPSTAQAALSTAKAVIVYSSSDTDVAYILNQINFTNNVWYFEYTDAFNNSLRAFNTITENKKLNNFYESFYWLSENISEYASNFDNSTKSYISGVKYFDSGQPYNYAVGQNNVYSTKSSTTEEIITKSVTQSLNNINQSELLQDEQYERLLDEMNVAPAGSVASINQDESIIYHVGIDGLVMTSNVTRIANAAKGFYDDYGADFINYGKSVKSVTSTLVDAGNGKVSMGIFQKSFMAPGVPTKFMNIGVGDGIGLGIGLTTMSYQFAVAQSTEDPIMRKAAYESAASAGIGVGFSVAAIMFPPAAVIQPTWIATYYAIWGPLLLADKLGWISIDQGPFGEIAKSPSDSIVFIVQFESGQSIPSAVALNAFNEVFEDQQEFIQDWYTPAVIVEPK